MKKQNGKISAQTMVLGAILTAMVVVLQFMGAFVRFGPFSISLVLVPIVIGAATCGYFVGTWLGFVFGIVVLLSGDASVFLAVNPLGTILTVILKGAFCGFFAGLAYKLAAKANKYFAVGLSAVVCPLVNTGIFLIGCIVFFMPTITEWAISLGFGNNVAKYMIFGLVGANFLFELLTNIILSPIIVRLINLRKVN
jgi:uncharacterized membrane protein